MIDFKNWPALHYLCKFMKKKTKKKNKNPQTNKNKYKQTQNKSANKQ